MGGAYWKGALIFKNFPLGGGAYWKGALIGRRALIRVITVSSNFICLVFSIFFFNFMHF